MADFIGVALENERLTALRFERFPEFARRRLLAALERIERRLEAAVRAAEPVLTGKLRADTGGRVYEHENRIAAVVGVRIDPAMGKTKRGSNAAGKAAALAYGSHTAIEVRAYAGIGRLRQRAAAGGTYTRHTNIAPHDFLKGPIAAMREEALASMRQALAEAGHEASA